MFNMFTKAFWLDTAERAVKTFVQAILSVLVVSGTTVLNADWTAGLATAATAALISVFTSLVSSAVNKAEDDYPATASVLSNVTYETTRPAGVR